MLLLEEIQSLEEMLDLGNITQELYIKLKKFQRKREVEMEAEMAKALKEAEAKEKW
jgi:hypothetical protein